MRRQLAAAAASASVGCLVLAEAQRRLRRHRRERKQAAAMLTRALRADSWALQAAVLVQARLSPGERPRSLSVVSRSADGMRWVHTARPGEDGITVTTRRAEE